MLFTTTIRLYGFKHCKYNDSFPKCKYIKYIFDLYM